MVLSIFLAKFLGLYLLIVAILGMTRKEHVQAIIKGFMGSPSLIGFAGILSLIFGLLILISHPVAALNWQGLITLLGALSLVKGVMRIGFTEHVQKFAAALMDKGYFAVMIIAGLLGIYLTYCGFAASL